MNHAMSFDPFPSIPEIRVIIIDCDGTILLAQKLVQDDSEQSGKSVAQSEPF
jgi:hypothetical protein